MTEILNLMKCFPDSYINAAGNLILDRKGNVYFTVTSGMTREDIMAKIFEWCSRDCAKAEPYSQRKRNGEWRSSLILKFDKYLEKTFDNNDWYWIYDRLGNGINHKLTLWFIRDGCDVKRLLQKEIGEV